LIRRRSRILGRMALTIWKKYFWVQIGNTNT
jgi:hypothetical protein